MDSDIPQQEYFKSVRQVACPNCGGELELINKRTRYVGCKFCGAQLDTSSETAQLLMQLEAPDQYPPQSFIDLGKRATFDGVEYIVVGRRRWYADYLEYWSEWDDDELEQGYERASWEYDEWLLLSQYQTFFFINEDREGYHITQEIVPWEPQLPRGAESGELEGFERLNFMGGTPKMIQEFGVAQVLQTIGESTYQVQTGDRSEFAAYYDGDSVYQVEWRRDEQGAIMEIEFFHQQSVDRSTLEKAFGEGGHEGGGASLEEALEDHSERYSREAVLENMQGARYWKLVAYGCLGLAVLFLVLAFVLPQQLGTVAEQEFQLNYDQLEGGAAPQQDNNRGGSPNQNKPAKVYFMGDFQVELDQKGKDYRFTIIPDYVPAVNKGSNQYLQVGLEIVEQISKDSIPIRNMETKFDNVDEDRVSAEYHLEQAGSYKVRVFTQPEFSDIEGKVKVKIERIQPRNNLWLGFWIFLVVGGVLYIANLFKEKRWQPYLETATQDLLGKEQ
jgi:hypothetical protein